MAMSVEFDAAARVEFDDAFNWYAQRSRGAAIGFATEIDVAIEAVTADPNRFQQTYAGCQFYRLKRYPYCVIYYRVRNSVRVVAVAHAKRRPAYWRERL